MEYYISSIKEAMRSNSKTAKTNKGSRTLPIIYVNQNKTMVTIKAVYPVKYFTVREVEEIYDRVYKKLRLYPARFQIVIVTSVALGVPANVIRVRLYR